MGRVVAGLVMVLACAGTVLALHQVFVTTVTGQLVDDATLAGGRIGQDYVREAAFAVLWLVSAAGVVVSVALVVVIGVARRRYRRAALAAALVLGPTLTTQLLKHYVLQRPELTDVGGAIMNSLPSGHTTFAGALSAGILVALPPRARPLGALLAAAYTAATGIATVAVSWHRASDVVAAVAVVGAWLGLAAVVLAVRRGALTAETDTRAVSGWRAVVPVLLIVAVLGLAAYAVSMALLAGSSLPVTGRAGLALAYGGSAGGVAGLSSAVFVAALLLLRPPRRRSRRVAGARSRDDGLAHVA